MKAGGGSSGTGRREERSEQTTAAPLRVGWKLYTAGEKLHDAFIQKSEDKHELLVTKVWKWQNIRHGGQGHRWPGIG